MPLTLALEIVATLLVSAKTVEKVNVAFRSGDVTQVTQSFAAWANSHLLC